MFDRHPARVRAALSLMLTLALVASVVLSVGGLGRAEAVAPAIATPD